MTNGGALLALAQPVEPMLGMQPRLFTFGVQYVTGRELQPVSLSSIPSTCVQPSVWPELTVSQSPFTGAMNTMTNRVHCAGAGAGAVKNTVPIVCGSIVNPTSTRPIELLDVRPE